MLVIIEIGVNFDWVGVAVNVSDDVVVIVVVVMIVVAMAEVIDVAGNAVTLGVLVAAGAGAAVLAGFAGCGVGDDAFVAIAVATFAGGVVATAVPAWVGRAAVGALVGNEVATAVGTAVGGGVETGTAVGNAVGGRVATVVTVGCDGAEVAGAAVGGGGGGAEVAGCGVLTGCSTPLVTTTCGVFAAMTKDAVNGISLSLINWVASMYK